MLQIPARIGGQPISNGRWIDVVNPYSGDVIARIPELDAQHVDDAVAAAAAVLARPTLPESTRAQILDTAATLLAERTDEFARTICEESGKPITTARGEVGRCIETLRHCAAEARGHLGSALPVDPGATGARLALTVRRPRGVLAAITPFNFPLNLVAHKLGPAVAAGCPVVLKPAELTPLSALALVDLLVEAGLPIDWISTVTGTGAGVGAALAAHPVPAVVSFTGSVGVGRAIERAALGRKVLLELGSNAPVIIEPDGDVTRAVKAIRAGGFSFSGQSCISTQRVLVHESLFEEVVGLLTDAVATLVTGDPADPATEVGPLITPAQTSRVLEWLELARVAGAKVIGGEMDGVVLRPALVIEPDRDQLIYRGEVFGPVVTVTPYRDFDEAVELANDADFGLHAGVFTSRLDTALKAADQLSFGGVLINDVPTVRLDHAPYGGLRDSGNTREGPHYAVEELTEHRFILFAA